MLKLAVLAVILTQVFADISIVEYGGKIPQEGPFDMFFQYTNPSVTECIVSLKNKDENMKQYFLEKFACSSGTHWRALTMKRDNSAIPLGGNYLLEVQLYNGGNKVDYRGLTVAVTYGRQGFHTYQDKLVDGNKKDFIIRGINNPHGDRDNYQRWTAYNALPNINSVNANTVRIVWYNKRKDPRDEMPVSDLEKIIQKCIELQIVPLVELHDTTDSDDPAKLLEAAKWWASIVRTLIKFRRHILVNIGNEWSLHGKKPADWAAAYKNAINVIRGAGYSGTLIVDAPAYAQDPNGPKLHGQELINFDSQHNLVFSCHLYFEWANNYKWRYDIVNELQAIKNAKVPFIVGEFASEHEGTDEFGKKVTGIIDAQKIMNECQKHGFGYIGWSWCGNGDNVKNLDIAPNWGTSLSTWGKMLVDGTNGIRITSKRATVFP